MTGTKRELESTETAALPSGAAEEKENPVQSVVSPGRHNRSAKHGVQKVPKAPEGLQEQRRNALVQLLQKPGVVREAAKRTAKVAAGQASPVAKTASAPAASAERAEQQKTGSVVDGGVKSVGPEAPAGAQGPERAAGGPQTPPATCAGPEKVHIGVAELPQPPKAQSRTAEPRRDPGPFPDISKLLYEFEAAEERPEFYAEVFGQVGEPAECARVAALSFEQWTAMGEEIMEEQRQLMGRMVANRAKLSYQFETITQVITERARALVEHGTQFREKLERIQSLGKEILDII
ncbi:AaceriAER320Cp [[Ashbya] aceris (nom. inval.)]|nr:AaceriAER320Cp [[Ashbya] aceris (nom. inval.)]